MSQWPTARLDPVRQLQVLAGILPGVGLVERMLDAPYQQVWSWLADLERSVPALDPMVGSLRVLSREGERLTVATRLPLLPLTLRFQVELREGWCLMRSRAYLVGMAAVPLGTQTRYAIWRVFPGAAGRSCGCCGPCTVAWSAATSAESSGLSPHSNDRRQPPRE